MGDPGTPSFGFQALHAKLEALKEHLRDAIKKGKKAKNKIHPKGKHAPGSPEGNAELLGQILGNPIYLDQGGSLGIGDTDNPFNPTQDTPLGANPGGKP